MNLFHRFHRERIICVKIFYYFYCISSWEISAFFTHRESINPTLLCSHFYYAINKDICSKWKSLLSNLPFSSYKTTVFIKQRSQFSLLRGHKLWSFIHFSTRGQFVDVKDAARTPRRAQTDLLSVCLDISVRSQNLIGHTSAGCHFEEQLTFAFSLHQIHYWARASDISDNVCLPVCVCMCVMSYLGMPHWHFIGC